MKYVIGLDAGTTCFKAGLYDEKLNTIEMASMEYELIYENDFIEYKAEEYFNSFCTLIKTLIEKSKVSPEDVLGLAISSQGETIILLGENGEPLRNAIVWTDARATKQRDDLKRLFPDEKVFEITGQREIAVGWPATKLLWIKENEPTIFNKISKVLLLEDYLIYRLTGVFATSKALSSSTVYFDINKGQWWNEMLSVLEIDTNKLPSLYDSGQKIAPLFEEGAKLCGLTTETYAVSGALDQAAGMLGAGNIESGIITETTGTCLAVCANIGNSKPKFTDGFLPIHYGLDKNSFYTIYWSAAAGSIYRFIRDVFYASDDMNDAFKKIDAEASVIKKGCDGLMLMPYLSGINYPVINETAKGEFLSMSLFHTRAHFARATLEAIGFLLMQSIEEITNYGINIKKIYSLGGGALSKLWNQIKSDILGRQIITLTEEETTCKGAAMMSAVGVGLYKNFSDVVSNTIKIKDVYSPEVCDDYKKIYATFSEKLKDYCNRI